MSENLRRFTEGIYAFDAVVRRTDEGAWGNASPCQGWDARAVLEHQCAVLNGVQAVAATGAMAKPAPPDNLDDPAATWTETRDRLLTTLDQRAVLAQKGPFWFNAATVDDMVGIVTWDLVGHTWDLAQASRQSPAMSDDLVAAAIGVVEPMSEMLVESARTGPVLAVADDASILDRFLGLVGRAPS